MLKRLTWEQVRELLRRLEERGYTVLHPSKNEFGDWMPREGIPDRWPEDFPNYLFPVLREIVLPSPEPVFRIEDYSPVFHSYGKIAFFGARPCDATALAYTDAFYLERLFRDKHYEKRRRDLFVITVACTKPCENSFCRTMDAGPFARKGFDIQLYPVNGHWYAEAGSDAGKELLSDYPDADAGELEGWKSEVLERFPVFDRNKLRYPIPPSVRGFLSDRCFACGGCIWLCPTCTCYNERTPAGMNVVVREQDACLLSGYHRLAKGASLRPTMNDMMGFRYECKLGIGSCTGCGRCSTTCIGYAAMEAYLEKVVGGEGA